MLSVVIFSLLNANAYRVIQLSSTSQPLKYKGKFDLSLYKGMDEDTVKLDMKNGIRKTCHKNKNNFLIRYLCQLVIKSLHKWNKNAKKMHFFDS